MKTEELFIGLLDTHKKRQSNNVLEGVVSDYNNTEKTVNITYNEGTTISGVRLYSADEPTPTIDIIPKVGSPVSFMRMRSGISSPYFVVSLDEIEGVNIKINNTEVSVKEGEITVSVGLFKFTVSDSEITIKKGALSFFNLLSSYLEELEKMTFISTSPGTPTSTAANLPLLISKRALLKDFLK